MSRNLCELHRSANLRVFATETGLWRGYACSGHGGNLELRDNKAGNLRFSILQRTSPDLEAADVIALGANWKERLHAREFGLNRN